jgi:hypothetical protein
MWPDPGARKLSPSDKSGAENYISRIHQWHRKQTSFTWINNAKIKKHRPPRVSGSQLHSKFIHLSSVLPFDFKPNRSQAFKCNLRAEAGSIIMRCNQRQKVAE